MVLIAANILKTISDEKALSLFKTIALRNGDRDALLSRTKITHKQYHSRIAHLIKDGLIKRKSGKYFLTSAGKVVYNSHIIIEIAMNNYYWKLNAIDLLEPKDLPQEEYVKIVNTLIDNNKIKEIILLESL